MAEISLKNREFRNRRDLFLLKSSYLPSLDKNEKQLKIITEYF